MQAKPKNTDKTSHRRRQGVASDLGLDEILAKISAVTGSRRPDGMIVSGTTTGGVFPQPQAYDPYRAPASPMRENTYAYQQPNVRIYVESFVLVCDV